MTKKSKKIQQIKPVCVFQPGCTYYSGKSRYKVIDITPDELLIIAPYVGCVCHTKKALPVKLRIHAATKSQCVRIGDGFDGASFLSSLNICK